MTFYRASRLQFIRIIERGNSITDGYHKNNCWKPLFDNIRRKRSSAGLCSVKLHHEKARSYETNDTQIFLQEGEEEIMIISHPLYSPGYAPLDF